MKIKPIITLFLALALSSGCITADRTGAKEEKLKVYFNDLDGDGSKEIIKTEDKTITDYLSTLSVKNKLTNATDTLSISGKIKKVEFPELNHDGNRQIAIFFEGQNELSNIAIYQLNNDKLLRIFAATSAYGIDTDFGLVSRVRIGKAARHKNPLIFSLDWDNWVWSGDKFVMD